MTSFISLLFACSTQAPEPSEPVEPEPVVEPEPEPSTKWEKRTDEQLASVVDEACAAATANEQAVLLEFSAPWCHDCKKLQELEEKPVLAEALSKVERVTVDVGRFDRHTDLIESFEVGAIAFWALLEPTDCDQPITEWPVKKKGTFEVESNAKGPRTAEDVAAWLEG